MAGLSKKKNIQILKILSVFTVYVVTASDDLIYTNH